MRRQIRLLAAVALALVALLSQGWAQSLQSNLYSYLSAASNNATLVYGGPAILKSIVAVNTTNTIYYLKLYNKATAPTCGTDTPVMRIPITQNNNGNGFVVIADDYRFPLGVGFCLVANLADNDNTNAATGIALNFGVYWQ